MLKRMILLVILMFAASFCTWLILSQLNSGWISGEDRPYLLPTGLEVFYANEEPGRILFHTSYLYAQKTGPTRLLPVLKKAPLYFESPRVFGVEGLPEELLQPTFIAWLTHEHDIVRFGGQVYIKPAGPDVAMAMLSRDGNQLTEMEIVSKFVLSEEGKIKLKRHSLDWPGLIELELQPRTSYWSDTCDGQMEGFTVSDDFPYYLITDESFCGMGREDVPGLEPYCIVRSKPKSLPEPKAEVPLTPGAGWDS